MIVMRGVLSYCLCFFIKKYEISSILFYIEKNSYGIKHNAKKKNLIYALTLLSTMLKKVDQKTVLTDDNKTVENIQDAITNIKKNQNMEDSIKTILNLPMGIKCLDNYDQLDPKIKNAINIYLQEAGRIEGVFSTEDKVNHNDPSKTTISLSEPLLSNTLKLGVVKRNFVKLALLLQGITLSYNEKEISFAERGEGFDLRQVLNKPIGG